MDVGTYYCNPDERPIGRPPTALVAAAVSAAAAAAGAVERANERAGARTQCSRKYTDNPPTFLWRFPGELKRVRYTCVDVCVCVGTLMCLLFDTEAHHIGTPSEVMKINS